MEYRTRVNLFIVAVLALTTFGTVVLPAAAALGAVTPPLNARMAYAGNPTFYDSSFAVVPGSRVSLHWSGGSAQLSGGGVHFVLTSNLPGFSSDSVVKWPSSTSPTPTWNGTGWVSTAKGMSVKIQSGAAPGTRYIVAIEACSSTTCIAPAKTTTLTVSPTKWAMQSYRTNFSKVATFPTSGSPFATTFLTSSNSIWTASEYSHQIVEIPSSAKSKATVLVIPTTGAPKGFGKPFAWCNSTNCAPTSKSALSEAVTTTNGWIWTTFGGWRVYSNGQRDAGGDAGGQPSAVQRQTNVPNDSEVVALDPTTGRFCTYLVPGANTQVAGVAVTGASPHINVWFVASYGSSGEGSLDEFNPSTIGRGCNGRTNKYFTLPKSVKRLSWPNSGAQWPEQIAVDRSAQTLWISDFNPYVAHRTIYSGIDRVDIADPTHPTFVQRYLYPTVNISSIFGAKPWDIVAPPNSNYVYAADNGDAEIVRINKTTNQIQEFPVPLTTDLENAFGLAISSGRLYFTLADDYDENELKFGAASTFGYINLSSWPDDGPPAHGVIYTGLNPVTDPRPWANYRAIAVGPTGQVALTDNYGTVRLTP